MLDGVSAAVAYGPIARALALRLKYGGRPGVARTMGAAMLRLAEPGWLLVPVPLHRWRLWSRGFNQSAFIARDLGRRAGLPVAIDLLRRTRATPKLRGLGAAARARAVRNAFEVAPSGKAAGARILLVDDVCTSGATAEACARALKAAGASEVRLICWARVLPDMRSEH
ncbi:comF family protein [Sphingomonas jatrophae]|uniref:ComF family protein n=1 Tax=Sphingomonas jatrophae TaxID=1166337 RepID=A0A1I6JSE9_9SPHN|nr:comF family protein [Sphingomonas jatrophae]